MSRGIVVVCAWKDGVLRRYAFPYEFGGYAFGLSGMTAARHAGRFCRQHGLKVEAVRVQRDDGGDWTDADLCGPAWLAVMDGFSSVEPTIHKRTQGR